MNEAGSDGLYHDLKKFVRATPEKQNSIINGAPVNEAGLALDDMMPVRDVEPATPGEFLTVLKQEIDAHDGPLGEWRPYFPEEALTLEEREAAKVNAQFLLGNYKQSLEMGVQLGPKTIQILLDGAEIGDPLTIKHTLGAVMREYARNRKLVHETRKLPELQRLKPLLANVELPEAPLDIHTQATLWEEAHQGYARLIQRLHKLVYPQPQAQIQTA